MNCKEKNCDGVIKDGRCPRCASVQGVDSLPTPPSNSAQAMEVAVLSKSISTEQASADRAGVESLLQEAEAIKDQEPNSYTSWRSRADILTSAIRKLENREIETDSTTKIFGVPLVESELRDAAEKALRHCAHFANTFDERISLVDAANDIRNLTWF